MFGSHLPLRVSLLVLCGSLTWLACGDDNGGSTGPDPTGSLEVALTISGDMIDADGCVFTVDGGTQRRITSGESTTYTGLSVGQHEVAISDVAGNCQVQGAVVRTVSVAADQTATVTYAVTCAQAVGSIDVHMTTEGEDQDADGYEVVIDGGAPAAIGINGTLLVGGLTAGDHTVAIGGVAPNCSVAGGNPRTVAVAVGQTTHSAFAVTCSATSGSIAVSASTSGEDLDADGYEVVVDGGAPSVIGINGSMTAGGLAPGDHTVELLGGAFNCSVAGNNPRTVTVTAGVEMPVTFDVTCRYHLYNRIAYVSVSASAMTLHSVDPQIPRVVRSLGLEGEHPAVSPDGLRIAYDWGHDIWVAHSDGSNAVNLTDNAEAEEFPAWSPDGSRLVFERSSILWLMDANGSNPVSLGVDGWAPTWSPDGTRIAFASAAGVSSNEIWVMNADGSGTPLNVSNHTAWDAHPAWSPLGNYIAFSSARSGSVQVHIVDPAGGPVVDMTGGMVSAASSPTWAPEAVAGAFQSDAGGNEDIYYFDPNGGGLPVLLTTSTAPDIQPTWGGGN